MRCSVPARAIRRSSSRRALLCLGAALALGASVAAPALAEGKKARRAKLEQINERWVGAEVRLKHAWKFKGKKNDGWYVGGVYRTNDARTFKLLSYRLRVRDIEPLRLSIASDHLIPGTLFISEGFKFREAKDEQGVYLALRTVRGDVPAEIVFFGQAGKPDLKGVEPIEQFLRMEVLSVKPPQERLVAAADAPAPVRGRGPFGLAPPAPTSAPASAPAASSPASDPAVFRPAVEILAVSVDPVQVRAGDTIDLIASYTVEGLPAGAAFEVVERRTLLAGERALTTDETPVPRTNGTYTSSQSARIPEAAGPGVYRLDVEVTLPGVDPVEASALFEVRP